MIVIDASVAVKWIREEDNSKIALELLESHLSKTQEITVPLLLFYEVANMVATKSLTRPNTIRKDLQTIFRAGLLLHKHTDEELIQATLLSKRCQTSVYDTLYAVIAKRLNTILVTADGKFIAKTKFRHVKLLSEYRP